MVPPVDHDCSLMPVLVEMSNELEKLRHEVAQLKKARYGPRSERTKMPPLPAEPVTAAEQLATRQSNARDKAQIQTLRTEHKVPAEQRVCPRCGNDELKTIGDGRSSVVFEFVPARFVRHEHVQEVLRCKCGDYVVTAPGAPKVVEKGRYGASFLAHLVVAKCADHLPIYRLEKEFRRHGFPLARSTMNELLHRTAQLTEPLSRRLLERIRVADIVQADETRLRMLDDGEGKPKTGFVWTFVAADEDGAADVAFVFADSRSGETPRRVLSDTNGYLLVDAYGGYDGVEEVSRRKRAGCHAHVRRYFHDALATASVAQEAIDLILALYRVEHDAQTRQIVGTARHLRLRRKRSAAIREKLKLWLDSQFPNHPPRSPIGVAIRYARKQWPELGQFLDDARVPLDNNASERSLRRVALGRKNYLFVGNASSGANLAGLYTLIATCEVRRINPFAYLADVLTRVQDHPAKKIDDLLPGAWAAARSAA